VGIPPEKIIIKKNKKRKGINVVYGFSNVFSVKWINCLIIFSSFIYLY